ncbi:methylated-DNA--[protein]-cysteine S-methyltransferase [Butyrivibrio sp. AE2032]|uniref:methylated-DNA--[protein]-cysteine S-methyltransferase n=1 Tax=Butyrivibrio sp. AE2032 TaxID=1458463 RepID=UPI0006923ACB|nr:methylated-DNA--[protein]-cysteine S-methyltransferase [Butyrivibrio sp. AE2032]
MADKIDLRKIHIGDSSELRKRGLMEGTLKFIEDDIRSFGTGSQGEALLASKEGVIYALIKLFRPDRKNCRAHIEFVFTNDANADTQSGVVDEVLRYCFLSEYYHKVTVICDHGNEGLERILMGAGFTQEAVLKDEVRLKNGFEDAGLFAILSYEYKAYNICFVPFARGVAIVSGGRDYIDSVKLFHYGQAVEDPFVRNVAAGLGLLDDNGGLVRNDNGDYTLEKEQLKFLPEELAKAYVELSEYFRSNRAGFDLNVRFNTGTAFQKKVWGALVTIPFGGTASYEDIALKLTDGNLSEARKITRAVGAACSDNPVAVIVPCHRVIGKDGSIVGYSAGIDIKDYLLLHESFTAVTPLVSKEG